MIFSATDQEENGMVLDGDDNGDNRGLRLGGHRLECFTRGFQNGMENM